MKIALQLGLVPGATTADRAKWARDHGVEGIELSAWSGLETMKKDADALQGIVPVVSVLSLIHI